LILMNPSSINIPGQNDNGYPRERQSMHFET
jgi:hypothetical protein